MDILEVELRGRLVARRQITGRPMELGRAAECDVVLDDPALAERELLVTRMRGSVFAVDVSRGKRHVGMARHLPLGEGIRLGEYRLLRRELGSAGPAGGQTEELEPSHVAAAVMRVLVGRGPDARRYLLDEQPLHLGRGSDNDVVLSDRAVSLRHLRLEPGDGGVLVRDLASRNGTFVNGVRVQTALLALGGHVRLGHVELRLVARAEAEPDARAMIAESPAMLELLAEAQRAAALSWPVLVHGESGTGKESVALALHELGCRAGGPYVALNAGGLATNLLEAELFGHERGAFTGANQTHRGLFEQAHGGTLFLDEIGELPLECQARLLRVLESGELRRVGGESTLRVDVRLVCATHRDLRAMVADGRFREDLYYRIARLVLEVPALRSRPEDVRALARHFLRQVRGELGVRELSSDAEARLVAYDWPGNARELRNVLCAAACATTAPWIDEQDVDRALRRVGGRHPARGQDAEAVQRAVVAYQGNLSAAARALGIPRTTLRDRLRASGCAPQV
jgi:transcriptional regulator with AAA-type ATPase domain